MRVDELELGDGAVQFNDFFEVKVRRRGVVRVGIDGESENKDDSSEGRPVTTRSSVRPKAHFIAFRKEGPSDRVDCLSITKACKCEVKCE